MKRNKNSEDNIIEANLNNIKEQNNNIRIDENDIAVIIKTGGNGKTPVLITVLPVLAMLLSLLPGIIKNAWNLETARDGIIALLLTGIVIFYIRFNFSNLHEKKLFAIIISINYLASLALLLFVPKPEIFCFWMLGGLLIAMLIDQKLGLLVHFVFSVFLGINFLDSPEAIIQILLNGILMIMLSKALKQKATVVYAAIIILSTNITVAFALNNFIFRKVNGFNYLYSLFSILLILIVAFTLNYLYNMKFGAITLPISNQSLKQDKSDGQADNNKQAQEDDNPDDNLYAASYELLCDKSNALLLKLKEYSETLYTHSERIADLSSRAAAELGADEKLALAGGLYHEIGRIKGGVSYIDDGLAIADEYKFPAELKAIIREHNIKYEKPSSVEAAIVMLSDSVESTINYIFKNEGNKYSTEKIIDNIFKLRLNKGSFDACPLKVNDFMKLKNFYVREYENMKN